MSTPTSVRENIGIAVDGGGVKGAIVAHGLIELENLLGVSPLINHPNLRVIAGTSTGAVIAASLAIGMTGQEILDFYVNLGKEVFSKSGRIRPFGVPIPILKQLGLPIGLLRFLDKLPLNLGDFLLYPLLPARYSFDPLRQVMLNELKKRNFLNGNPTMREVGEFLNTKPGKPAIVMTAVEVAARQTRFIKSTSTDEYADMKLVEGVLASSCIPTFWDPIPTPNTGGKSKTYLVDGGVGNYGNPVQSLTREIMHPYSDDKLDPNTVTIFSFGTGFLSNEKYRKAANPVTRWWALDWATRAPDLFINDAIREQSRDVIAQFPGVDFRRFQTSLDRQVAADDFSQIDGILRELGLKLRERIRLNQHALSGPPGNPFDPEGIQDADTWRTIRATLGTP